MKKSLLMLIASSILLISCGNSSDEEKSASDVKKEDTVVKTEENTKESSFPQICKDVREKLSAIKESGKIQENQIAPIENSFKQLEKSWDESFNEEQKTALEKNCEQVKMGLDQMPL